MADIAQLVVRISGDDKGSQESLDRTSGKVEKAKGGFKSALENALAFVGADAVFQGTSQAVGWVVSAVGDLVSAGMEANQVQAQTVAGLKSTGDASGMTAQSVGDLADHLSNMTGISADTIQTSENMLLTFTNIGKNVFPQATQAVADLATKMANGGIPNMAQMQAASIQLGKALGDPAKGYAQLQRVGVTFTKSQIDSIKTMEKSGNIAGAQAVILKEMNKEFGGSAAAAGQANGGISVFTAQLENAKEKIGQAIIPILVKLMNAIQPLTTALSDDLPAAIAKVQGWFEQFQPVMDAIGNAAQGLGHLFMDTLKPGLDALGNAFSKTKGPGIDLHDVMRQVMDVVKRAAPVVKEIAGHLSDFFKAIAPLIPKVQDFVGALLKVVGANIQDTFTELGAVFNGIGQAVQNLMPHIQSFVKVIQDNIVPAVQTIVPLMVNLGHVTANIVGAALRFILPIVGTLAGLLLDVLGKAISFIAGIIRVVVPLIGQLAGWLGDHLSPIVKNVGQAIGELVNWFQTQLLPVLQKVWDFFQSSILPILQDVGNVVKTVVIDTLQALWALISNILLPILGKLAELVAHTVGTAFEVIGGILKNVVAPAFGFVVGAIGGFLGALGWVKDRIGDLLGLLGRLKDFLGGALSNAWNAIGNLIQGVWNTIGGVIKAAINGWIDIINGLISAIDNIHVSIPQVGPFGGGSVGFSIPLIPHLASGGDVSGLFVGGEDGAELLTKPGLYKAPAGSHVYSARDTANILSAAASGRRGDGGGSGAGAPQTIILEIDGRQLARILLPHQVQAIRNATGIRSL